MFKKRSICLILLLVVMLSVPGFVSGQASGIDTSSLGQGVVKITYDSSEKTKVVIKKDNIKYTYDLNSSGIYPLTMGNGDYEVEIVENLSGNKYAVVEEDTVNLNLEDQTKVFLQSVQVVSWDNSMEAIKKADTLTKNLKSDSEKARAIYNYIVKNYKYDYSKLNKISSSYIPDIEAVYKNKKGICYDFAALYAAMVRSIGIPTKLLTGNNKNIESYHSWNQVYLKESKKWVTIDITYDSIMLENSKKVSMIKSSSDYKIDKVY